MRGNLSPVTSVNLDSSHDPYALPLPKDHQKRLCTLPEGPMGRGHKTVPGKNHWQRRISAKFGVYCETPTAPKGI